MLQGNKSGNEYSCQIKRNLQSRDLVVKALTNYVLPRVALLDHNDGNTIKKVFTWSSTAVKIATLSEHISISVPYGRRINLF